MRKLTERQKQNILKAISDIELGLEEYSCHSVQNNAGRGTRTLYENFFGGSYGISVEDVISKIDGTRFEKPYSKGSLNKVKQNRLTMLALFLAAGS